MKWNEMKRNGRRTISLLIHTMAGRRIKDSRIGFLGDSAYCWRGSFWGMWQQWWRFWLLRGCLGMESSTATAQAQSVVTVTDFDSFYCPSWWTIGTHPMWGQTMQAIARTKMAMGIEEKRTGCPSRYDCRRRRCHENKDSDGNDEEFVVNQKMPSMHYLSKHVEVAINPKVLSTQEHLLSFLRRPGHSWAIFGHLSHVFTIVPVFNDNNPHECILPELHQDCFRSWRFMGLGIGLVSWVLQSD